MPPLRGSIQTRLFHGDPYGNLGATAEVKPLFTRWYDLPKSTVEALYERRRLVVDQTRPKY